LRVFGAASLAGNAAPVSNTLLIAPAGFCAGAAPAGVRMTVCFSMGSPALKSGGG